MWESRVLWFGDSNARFSICSALGFRVESLGFRVDFLVLGLTSGGTSPHAQTDFDNCSKVCQGYVGL